MPPVFPVGEGENTFQVLGLMSDRCKITRPVLGGRPLLPALTISALAPILLLDLCAGQGSEPGEDYGGLAVQSCLPW